MKRKRSWLGTLWSRLLCIVTATGFAAGVCSAQDATAQREAQLKAAYVFNFIKFVNWDSGALTNTLDICFDGADDVREALAEATADKTVGTRKVAVHAVGPDSRQRCSVLFVASARPMATRWTSESALTIGDAPGFTQKGGIIRLYTESNRLRFIVNVGNARRAGVQISSNLLKLATQIEQEATL